MRSTGTEASWDNLSTYVFWGIFRQAEPIHAGMILCNFIFRRHQMCEFLVSLQHESICPFECFGGPGPYAELCKGVVYAAAYYPQPVPHGQWCALNMENISNWCREARLLWRKLEFLVLTSISKFCVKNLGCNTGLNWIGLVQLRLRCQDVTDWARVQVFFLTETQIL